MARPASPNYYTTHTLSDGRVRKAVMARCNQCKNIFTIPTSDIKRGSRGYFCSNKCHKDHDPRQQLIKPCLNCNKLMDVGSLKDYPRYKFCSGRCGILYRMTHKKEGEAKRNYHWAARQIYYTSTQNTSCECCGSTKFIHIHHINRNHKDNRLENLKALCRTCHQGHHKSKMHKFMGRYYHVAKVV